MQVKKVSIVVVSYNTRQMTIDCLASVFEQTSLTPFELIVWDNASSDGSVDAMRARFGDRIRLFASAENIGFAAANNRVAENASGDYLLLLNPDTVVLDRAIDKLLTFAAAEPQAGIWGGRTVFANGALNPASCWQRQTLWSLFCQAAGLSSLFKRSSLFNSEGMGGWDRTGTRHVDIVTGCFLLIRRNLWDELGGFREEFFMYGEEADLCLRARALNADPIVTSDATIIHYGGASERVRADKIVRLLRARMLLIERHFVPSWRGLGRQLLVVWPSSRYVVHAILSALGRRKSAEARDAWKGAMARRQDWLTAR